VQTILRILCVIFINFHGIVQKIVIFTESIGFERVKLSCLQRDLN
jgi:hypothetical protein